MSTTVIASPHGIPTFRVDLACIMYTYKFTVVDVGDRTSFASGFGVPNVREWNPPAVIRSFWNVVSDPAGSHFRIWPRAALLTLSIRSSRPSSNPCSLTVEPLSFDVRHALCQVAKF